MTIEVSVIMIAFNKYPQCLYSLYALESQTFEHSKMEVILVDDFSSDETLELENYAPPFKFKYIRPEKNVGRSKAKNIGIEAAAGNIIIFLDSEFLLDPGFIETQYRYHQSDQLLAVSTCMNHYGVYTVYDSQYTKKQMGHFRDMIKGQLGMLPPYTQAVIMDNLKKKPEGNKIGLFQKNDIVEQKYKLLSFPTPYIPEVIEIYGRELNRFYLPWMFVITHQLSVKKSVIDEIGMFYEGFEGYGVEDWEFGYRLYKHGVKIIDNAFGSIYHQEHPRNESSDTFESDKNYLAFFRIYRSFDIGCYFLWRLGKDLYFINDAVNEYNDLSNKYTNDYKELKETFIRIFEVVLEKTVARRKVTQLIQASGLDQGFIDRAFEQYKDLKRKNIYPHLTESLDFLLQF